jgi:hypothetical protein
VDRESSMQYENEKRAFIRWIVIHHCTATARCSGAGELFDYIEIHIDSNRKIIERPTYGIAQCYTAVDKNSH